MIRDEEPNAQNEVIHIHGTDSYSQDEEVLAQETHAHPQSDSEDHQIEVSDDTYNESDVQFISMNPISHTFSFGTGEEFQSRFNPNSPFADPSEEEKIK